MSSAAVRAGSLDDAPAAARLLAAVFADEVSSARSIRHSWASSPERVRRRSWAAEVDGELVGWAVAAGRPTSAEGGAAFGRVTVHPDRRRRGIGAALWEQVDAHLAELGARHVASEGLDDEPARRFMAARGFHLFSIERTSGLDPRTLGPPPLPPPGVALRPWSAFDDPTPIYRLTAETARDIPTDVPTDDVRWEDWLGWTWNAPDLDRDASLLALDGAEPVALTTLFVNAEARRALSALTGTVRRSRGRGLARLVKHHALVRAAEKGVTLAVASNHESNPGMVAVNERLGYRPLAARATYVRRPG